MIRRNITLVALVAAALAVACEKKEAPVPATEPSAAPAAAPAPAPAIPAATEPVVDASTLPVEEQFEADAEQEITAANLNQKLDELEKELSAP